MILHAGHNEGFVPNVEVVFRAHSSSGDYHAGNEPLNDCSLAG